MPKKVADLTGAELDYWVARAEGLESRLGVDMDGYTKPCCGVLRIPEHPDALPWWGIYRPSDNWEMGGPIIDREKISITQDLDATCDADRSAFAHMPDKVWQGCFGATALEAAMRCYVASKFGDEVNDELAHP